MADDDDDFVLNLDFGGPRGGGGEVKRQQATGGAERPAPSSNKGPQGKQASKQHPPAQAGRAPKPQQQQPQQQHRQQQPRQQQQQQQRPAGTGSAAGARAAPGANARPGHAAGGAKGKKPGPGGNQELEMRAADSDEEGEVAELLALVSKRDAALEQELRGASSGKRRGGGGGGGDDDDEDAGPGDVVDFSDDDEGGGGKRKKKRFAQVGSGGGGGHLEGEGGGGKQQRRGGKPGGGASAALQPQQPERVTLAPGQLTHGGAMGSAGLSEVFGEEAGDAPPTAAVPLQANGHGAAKHKKQRPQQQQPNGGAETAPAEPWAAAQAETTWSGLGLGAKLCEQLSSLQFERPTRVQRLSIPPMLAGRDVLVRAATGSGKTLSYLLPIIHDLAHQEPRLNRAEGTYALVVAPTRELCLQINDVAVQLLKRFIWLVSGVVIGGENRTHEKARLRKGVTLLVASPGRLADHLHSTTSFKTGELRWLVLDEADRLLDMGFEARLKEIVQLLDKRREEAQGAPGPGRKSRVTALLSATLHTGLAGLASMSLVRPVPVGFALKQGEGGQMHLSEAAAPAAKPSSDAAGGGGGEGGEVVVEAEGQRYVLPSQLKQAFVEVEAKQRLVTLAGLLRQKLLGGGASGAAGGASGGQHPFALLPGPEAPGGGKRGAKHKRRQQQRQAGGDGESDSGSDDDGGGGGHKAAGKAAGGAGGAAPAVKRKAVVFLSSCDGVELHHALLGGPAWRQAAGGPLLGVDMPLLKLHGDMPQAQRTAAFVTFSQANRAVLLCTDVAARGLDFPDVTCIIQYDVPSAPSEYVHRVGRTARIGHTGEAILMLMPHERAYVDLLASRGVRLDQAPADSALRWLPQLAPRMDDAGSFIAPGQGGKGPAGRGMQTAFDLQRRLMQVVASDSSLQSLASDAFRSFVRAYATASGDVKRQANVHVRNLHLGHVAFAHGLKTTPSTLGASGSSKERKRKRAEEVAHKQRSAKKDLYRKAAALSRSEGNGAAAGGSKPPASKKPKVAPP